jgi:hypothetical protein
LLLLPAPAGARPAQRTTVDAVVASVDGTAITLSDVERAYRLELFFEGKPCDATPDAAAIALGRDHLIDQALLLLEGRRDANTRGSTQKIWRRDNVSVGAPLARNERAGSD